MLNYEFRKKRMTFQNEYSISTEKSIIIDTKNSGLIFEYTPVPLGGKKAGCVGVNISWGQVHLADGTSPFLHSVVGHFSETDTGLSLFCFDENGDHLLIAQDIEGKYVNYSPLDKKNESLYFHSTVKYGNGTIYTVLPVEFNKHYKKGEDCDKQ